MNLGAGVEPREWFIVPLTAIDGGLKRIQDESIVDCVYDSSLGKLRKV
jgi:hypothetical protein